MATLTTARRNRLPAREFAEPEIRKYPIPDRAHAKNAKARAAQAVKAGRMSRAEQQRINAKADLMLYGGTSRARGHVFIVDGTGKGAPRSRLAPDNQPVYKIKPKDPRRVADGTKRKAAVRRAKP
jgi:hypothetical protein